MAVENEHECFIPPSDPNIKVWRYMDFSKFVSMLDAKALYLARADLLGDPYEGAMSHANTLLREKVYRGEIPQDAFEQMSKFNEWARTWTYINCWHSNQNESAAMWRLYSKSNESVAIQSTFLTLKEVLNKEAYIGVVHYIDYEKDWLPEGNGFWPYVHKRLSFEHEKEIRIVSLDVPVNSQGFERHKKNDKPGKLISVNLMKLVAKVYVSPTAPQWFVDLVRGVSQKYGFTFVIEQSLLSKKPVY